MINKDLTDHILQVQKIDVCYGNIKAISQLDFFVPKGKIVTILGANGAGKTTTLRAISGLEPLKKGKIFFNGKRLDTKEAHKIVQLGLSQSPEGRLVFPELSVFENLQLGGYTVKDKAFKERELEFIFSLFPRLKERLKQLAGTLSGGEQQMLAIGRALMASPKLLLLDEPSLGIAPILVQDIFKAITEINKRGVSILLVEQNAYQALQIADYGHVLETGRIILQDKAENLLNNPKVQEAYLGH